MEWALAGLVVAGFSFLYILCPGGNKAIFHSKTPWVVSKRLLLAQRPLSTPFAQVGT